MFSCMWNILLEDVRMRECALGPACGEILAYVDTTNPLYQLIRAILFVGDKGVENII